MWTRVENENGGASGAAPNSPRLFLTLFPSAFSLLFRWCLGDAGSLALFRNSGPVLENGEQATPSGGMWNQTFSVAGLNTTVSQDGLRCNPTRTASVFLWPRTAEKAGAATSEFFISMYSTGCLSGRIYVLGMTSDGHTGHFPPSLEPLPRGRQKTPAASGRIA